MALKINSNGFFQDLSSTKKKNQTVYPFVRQEGKRKDCFYVTFTTDKKDYKPMDLESFLDHLANGAFDSVGRIKMKPLAGGDDNGFSIHKATKSPVLIEEIARRQSLKKKTQFVDVSDQARSERDKNYDASSLLKNDDNKFRDIIDIADSQQPETTKQQLIQARLGQGKFKEDVIKVWRLGKRCAATNINIEELLIASHIIPWSESEELRLEGSNGILLCAHLDKLFDRYLISFDEEGQLIPSSRLTSTDLERFREIGVAQSLCLNMGYLSEKDKVAVKKHLTAHRQRLADKDQESTNEH